MSGISPAPVIVSDAGKAFAVDERPTEPGAAILVEAIDILMEQVRGLQFKRLELNAGTDGAAKPCGVSGAPLTGRGLRPCRCRAIVGARWSTGFRVTTESGSRNGRVRNRATGAAFRGQASLERQRPFPGRQQPARPGIRLRAALAARPCSHPQA